MDVIFEVWHADNLGHAAYNLTLTLTLVQICDHQIVFMKDQYIGSEVYKGGTFETFEITGYSHQIVCPYLGYMINNTDNATLTNWTYPSPSCIGKAIPVCNSIDFDTS